MDMAKVKPDPRNAAESARRMQPSVAAALGLVSALAAGAAAASDPVGTTFREDFLSFDPARWYISDGWSNGDHQNCQWSASAVDHLPGRVILEFLEDPTPTHTYRCGEIQTTARFGYGTFEAKIKTDDGSGLNAAFFTYIGPVHGERHDEIDFEMLTANVNEVTVNTYVDGKPHHGGVHRVGEPTNERFYVYSFIWEPGRLRWFVDGELIKDVQDPVVPERPQKMYFSLWGTETLNDWMGPFDSPTRPKRMEIDWVAYTSLGEPCQFDDSVLCKIAAD